MLDLLSSRPELSQGQFERISDLVKGLCGINLHTGKRELVHARLSKRLRQLNLTSFEDYLDRLADRSSEGELVTMLDMLSTNVTQFFREPQHFEFLRQRIVPDLLERKDHPRRVRIWSAGCSTGEEPYSIALQLDDQLTGPAGWETRILATDLSTRVLGFARQGLYPEARIKEVPALWKSKHFTLAQTQPQRLFRVSDVVRRLIHFGRLNLMESWPMHGPFDMIFCRNVMIYFDKPTQSNLVRRFAELLAPGGYMFLGHSESLAGVKHDLDYVQPTIYRKP